MSDIKARYLIKVEPNANNNKYYKMIPAGDKWTAEFGRVGAGCQRRVYSMSQFESKYRKKLKKGYVDQSEIAEDLFQEVKQSKPGSNFKEIENVVIAEIVERLQSMARDTVQKNYTVSSKAVTQKMVDAAQEIIDAMSGLCDAVDEFNVQLVKLCQTIPRKIGNVSSYMARTPDDTKKILAREQDLLDVMRGQVVQHQATETVDESEEKEDMTILEKLGIEFEECDRNDIARIKCELGDIADKFHKAWRVKNIKTQERFDRFVAENGIKNIKLLFHGSRSENWWSIINTGLVLRPTNAITNGKMFGYGTYFAPKARKSLGYTSLSGSYWARGNSNSGFMALMQVAYGEPYDVYSFDSKYHGFNYEKLQEAKPGANCLHAHAGKMLQNDEIIIYKEEQCTIKYLIELK